MNMRFIEGDNVRVDIPNKNDPDFEYRRSTDLVIDEISIQTATA